MTLARLGLQVKVVGQRSRSNAKYRVLTSLLPSFKVGSRSHSRSHSRSKSTFWRAAVDIRGSALPSAAKSKEESLSVQGVCLCVCLAHLCKLHGRLIYIAFCLSVRTGSKIGEYNSYLGKCEISAYTVVLSHLAQPARAPVNFRVWYLHVLSSRGELIANIRSHF